MPQNATTDLGRLGQSLTNGQQTTRDPYTLLVIDDDPLVADFYQEALSDRNLRIFSAIDAQSGLENVGSRRPHLVFLDLVMPQVTGMELLEQILRIDPSTDVILTTAYYSTESAVEAIQKGAFDYLTKPIPIDRLAEKVDKWIADADQRFQAMALDAELMQACKFEGIVGHSPVMLEMFSRLRRIAPHFQTVLVSGETGTGKELVAQALHRLSPRAHKPFVICNCAAIVESIFESELFGHSKGSFTGAVQDKTGLFEAAEGGALFLDEIGETPLSIQAKLLRVLQNQEVRRVGSTVARKVDVRVIAATNRDLRAMVERKEFREDLFYRLAMVEVKVPSLRERSDDLPLLQQHFLDVYSKRYQKPGIRLSRRAQASLTPYDWPGNVRELENLISYCCMMAERDVIDIQDIPKTVQTHNRAEPNFDSMLPLEEMNRRHAERVLQRAGGNRAKAAEILGISRTTLYRLLRDAPQPK